MTAKELENGTNFSLINNDATRDAIIVALEKDEHLPSNPHSEFFVFYSTIKEFVYKTPLSEILTMPMPDLYVEILARAIEGRISDFLCDNFALGKDGKLMNERIVALGLAKKYIYLGVEECPTHITDDDISTFVEQMGGRIIWGDDEDEQDGDEQEKHTHQVEQSICYHYEVKLSISYHKDYTVSNLSRRIARRLRYQWPNIIASVHINKENGKDKFDGTVTIYTEESDLKAVADKIFFRLGATSGKPWKRCHVLGIERKG